MSFKNKIVLITGASSGIGAATAKLFAKEGADVIITARNEEKLKNVAEDCCKLGKGAFIIKADVTNNDEVQRIIDETIAKFGKLDILINNAGKLSLGTILDGTILDVYNDMINTNLRAVIQLTTLAAPHLVKTKGNIVTVSSIASEITTVKEFGAYGASKAGLNQFTRVAAAELAPNGVRVNIVSPGPVYTDILENNGIRSLTYDHFGAMTALNRVSDAVEIADIIIFLASDKAKGITGSNYVCDNGYLLKH